MRRGSGSRTDQGEVLDDCYHVTSASGTLRSEDHVITAANKQRAVGIASSEFVYRSLLGK